MEHAVKLLSAVAFLGLGFISFNAHADCRCATGVPIGGNNCGIPKQPNGTGWQHIFPMTCTADSSTPSRSNDEGLDYAKMARQIDPAVLKTPVIVYAVDRRNDNVITAQTTEQNKSSVKSQLAQKCPDCEISDYTFYPLISQQYKATCLTIFKAPETTTVRGKGLFSKSKTATSMAYSSFIWGTAPKIPYTKETVTQDIKRKNGTALKDVCLK